MIDPTLQQQAEAFRDQLRAAADAFRERLNDMHGEAYIHVKGGGDPAEVPDLEALEAAAGSLDVVVLAMSAVARQCETITKFYAAIYDEALDTEDYE